MLSCFPSGPLQRTMGQLDFTDLLRTQPPEARPCCSKPFLPSNSCAGLFLALRLPCDGFLCVRSGWQDSAHLADAMRALKDAV